jgi:drug/metabolite transporter (DMT)-like permease
MDSQLLAILLGLASAASWGAGDFAGGVATKRTRVVGVVIASQLVGGILLLTLAIILAEAIPSPANLFFGGLAGIFGTLGLLALYQGLAKGQMGIVSPVAGVVAAALPVGLSLLSEGLPPIYHLVGFGVALTAVWFLSWGSTDTPIRAQQLWLPVAAGLAFGLFFVLIDQVSDETILWPLISARIASTGLLSIFCVIRGQRVLPERNRLTLIALAGMFDTGGNAFFALATRVGRLDISAVLGSLYPATTVLLAWLIVGERLERRQWLGVFAALVALVLIAL